MKKISALLFSAAGFLAILLIPVLLYADSPPSWSEFSVFSKGKKYRADVKSVSNEKNPRDRKWKLSVFDSGKKKPLWSSDFDFRFGYPGGILSADGKTFIMTEVWYHSDSVLVDIYREGKKLDTDHLTGKSFQISQEYLKRTASHFLWFEENRHYRFEKRSGRDFFVLIPFDGREHWIDLSTGKRENPE
ncbi:MAG TPA: hypothetical protein PK453_11690 [Leptospiraceae bacterium]|nr:hypothetical protein [Leptospiraceae bacterium]HNF14324.1 hypothetical protein [Leptospiraceae bacterium]HNF24883.1 hypothetical protein [Leptospiraceae bacterium]HNH11103.1 hypothetical protein [Leptospiraceae bacterium]HNI27508.1 hypothetical protein [Leptospiraceae bacterium]